MSHWECRRCFALLLASQERCSKCGDSYVQEQKDPVSEEVPGFVSEADRVDEPDEHEDEEISAENERAASDVDEDEDEDEDEQLYQSIVKATPQKSSESKSVPISAPSDDAEAEWECSICTMRNGTARTRCEACHSNKPSVSQHSFLSNDSDSSDSKSVAEPNLADLQPSHLLVAGSQFRFGGESACPFGTLEIGQALLSGKLVLSDPIEKQQNDFDAALKTAVETYRTYHQNGHSADHANPVEIINNTSTYQLTLCAWDYPSDVPWLSSLGPLILFPEVFLPMGEIQLLNGNFASLVVLLDGLAQSKSDRLVTFVNIGYVCGVVCQADGHFVVFDTHSKDLSPFGGGVGGYAVQFSSSKEAVSMLLNFSLSSRNEILKYAQGTHQVEAAQKIEVAVFRLSDTTKEQHVE